GDRHTDRDEAQEGARHPPIAFDRLVIFDMLRWRVPRRDRVMRKLRDEFLNRRLGIEADLDRIRADECAAEDAARQAGNVVALERFENAHRDLGGRGDLPKRDASSLPRLAQLAAEVAGDPVRGHVQWATVYVREPVSCCQTANESSARARAAIRST